MKSNGWFSKKKWKGKDTEVATLSGNNNNNTFSNGSKNVKSENYDSFLVSTLANAAIEHARGQQGSNVVKPSTASLEAVTAGTLHIKGAQFYTAMCVALVVAL